MISFNAEYISNLVYKVEHSISKWHENRCPVETLQ